MISQVFLVGTLGGIIWELQSTTAEVVIAAAIKLKGYFNCEILLYPYQAQIEECMQIGAKQQAIIHTVGIFALVRA